MDDRTKQTSQNSTKVLIQFGLAGYKKPKYQTESFGHFFWPFWIVLRTAHFKAGKLQYNTIEFKKISHKNAIELKKINDDI